VSDCFATILVLGIGIGTGGDDLNNVDGRDFGKYQIVQEIACPTPEVKIQINYEHISYVDNEEDAGVNMLMLEFKKVFK
jgi:hypothetical protein